MKTIIYKEREDEGRRLLESAELDAYALRNLKQRNIITERLQRYVEQILIISFCSWEAESFAGQYSYGSAINSLVKVRRALDGVASVLFDPNNLRPHTYQEELFGFAKGLYNEAVQKTEGILWRKTI